MSEDYKIAYENVMIANKMLEQENKQLKEEIKELNDNITWWTNRFNAVQRDYENLQTKIDKAIEYIKSWVLDEYSIAVLDEEDDICNYEPSAKEKLLKILGDKE